MGYYKNEEITEWTPVEPVEQIRVKPPVRAVEHVVHYETRRDRRNLNRPRDYSVAGAILAGMAVMFLLGLTLGLVV